MVIKSERLTQQPIVFNGVECHAYSYTTDTVINYEGEQQRLYIYTLIALDGKKLYAFKFYGKA